ncbi:MAG: recombinase family protein, partial [Candidatus Zipacnadales bacterium]
MNVIRWTIWRPRITLPGVPYCEQCRRRLRFAGRVKRGLRSLEGNCIDRLSIRKILTNVAYTGQVAFHRRQGGGVVARGKHPPIVDAALFAEVQETLACRRRYTPPARPFGREPYP